MPIFKEVKVKRNHHRNIYIIRYLRSAGTQASTLDRVLAAQVLKAARAGYHGRLHISR